MATITETGTIDLKAQKEAHDEAINAAASDATTKANAAQTAAINAAASDATTKANAAQTAAINAAASDATSKANAAAKTATNYITADSTGITVRMSQNATTYQRLTASESTWYVSGKKRSSVDGNGLKVYVGNAGSEVEVATFGSTVRLGKASEGHLEISQYDMAVYSGPSTKVMTAKSLNTSSSGYALIEEYARIRKDSTVSPPSCYIYVNHKIEDINCVINLDTSTTVPFTKYSDFALKYSGDLNASDIYNVIYYTSESVSAMELGKFAMAVGANSLAVGESMAGGSNSIAYGDNCEALGYSSISGGNGSKAFGRSSVAIGEGAIARFNGAVAFGNDTYANAHNQFVIGESNIIDNPNNFDGNTNNMYAFIIGNGDSSTRSNAFTVDWSGNTFPSGNIQFKVPTIDRDNPSSSIYDSAHSILLLDKDGEPIGIVRCLQLSDGRIGTTIAAYNENTSGSQVNNGLNVMVDRNGASSYSMTDPAAFRSAISAFSTGGGTITGPVYVKNTVIDRKVNPSSAQYSTDVGGYSAFILTDKNGATLGYIRASKQTDGRTGLDLRVWNSDTSGNNVVNGGFQILIDRSGAVTYSVPNQANFRNAIGASSGIFPRSVGGTGMSARTTGTITRSGLDTSGTMGAYSNGVVCTVSAANVHLKTALANGGSVTLATLPTGYRPPMSVYGNLCSNSSTNGKGYVGITSSGEIKFHNYKGSNWTTSDDIRFTITWAL